MTTTEMEDAIRNLERQVSGIVQILPTLATKADLERCATKADLEPYATKADLERFATKTDLVVVRSELRAEIADVKTHATVLFESLHDDIRVIAESVGNLVGTVDSNTTALLELTRRLQHKGVI